VGQADDALTFGEIGRHSSTLWRCCTVAGVDYLDSGSRDPAKTLHAWLTNHLPNSSFFGCQSGYFTADALYAFRAELEAVLNRGGQVRLVIGANEDELSASDLHDALNLLEPFPTHASIVIVSAVDVLVHAKTFYIEYPDGDRVALVGSANLTGSGLGANIEACLAVSSKTEPAAPFDEIKAAIEAWRTAGRPNARLLDRALVPKLAAAAAIDRPQPSRVAPKRSLRRLFPQIGRLIAIPRRVRKPPSTPVPAVSLVLLPGHPFPAGTVGIVKRLSSLDTKGFRGERGTLYVAMPRDLLPLLPTTPSGINKEPRLDLTLEARHASVSGPTVSSGANPTNITGVGHGTSKTSHHDVRLNLLRVTVAGIEYIAANAGVAVPKPGDYLAVEFDGGGHAARLTFVVQGRLKAQLAALLGSQSWAWLPEHSVPPW
jgi:hypothetical protein